MPPPPPTTELIDDVTAEIFLRLPPDEPDHLFRAALVCKCKPWLRVLYDPSFLRRYRAYHGAPPLLGFIHMLQLVASGGGSVLRFSSHSPRLPSSGVRQRPPHAVSSSCWRARAWISSSGMPSPVTDAACPCPVFCAADG
ncbi:unnamed protein product [Urochloa humidicola]